MSTIDSLPGGSSLWVEPESAANTTNPPQYPYNNITQTESGHTFELDDTPGGERVRLQHRSGTFIEMHPNGNEVHKVYGDGYEITIKNKNVLIKGTCNLTIEGDLNIDVKGDKTERIQGNYFLEVRKELNVRSVEDMTLSSDADVQVSANENFGGTIFLSASDSITVASDVAVIGSIGADFISSETRINAGTGVYAGTFGVNSLGPITSTVSVASPIATFGFSKSILATDVVNKNIYGFHVHPISNGFTGTPKLKQI